MVVFVYEYTCAALCGSALPASLRAEGLAMLSTVLDDLQRVTGVRTCTLLADDFPESPAQDCHRTGNEERDTFLRLAANADWTLVIAPEFDDLLATRCRWVEETGGRTLNSSLDAIRLTGDKVALARHLRKHGVPTPPTVLHVSASRVQFPTIFKPRFGAGSQATFLVCNEQELSRCITQAREEGFTGEAILQPFVPGQPASVAFLLGSGQCIPLWPAAQHLSEDGRFRYLGGTVPLPLPLGRRAVSLAERAVACVPGLRGYVGVDLVLGTAADGSEDVVIEINPRLTTSYIGLRHLTEVNLAAWMLELAGAPVATHGFPPLSPGCGEEGLGVRGMPFLPSPPAGEGLGVRGSGAAPGRARQVRFYADGHWNFL